MANVIAIKPITAKEAPSPMPAFAPTDRSLDGVLEDVCKAVENVDDGIALEVVEPEVAEAEVNVVV